MANKSRDILGNLVKNFINSLKPRQFRGNLMGTDYKGNQYYEIPKSDTNRRNARWFVPKDGNEDKFDSGLPAEWESWLRYRRKTPPTEEEVMKNLELMKSKESKAAEIERKFKGTSAPPGQPLTFPRYPEYEQRPGEKS
ncbi:NADH dehydrogenase [ubiquinone] 1 alpha subcomplex assembly factor 2 [Halyomorpha halys]|uniref:NADH dehydrogenase [ubiquinone] 1 alpha subcomplex assembly factor 2 n=1 Tax=Halyomorpha halys TaxID=286706 RepID=UPI0006D52625|nr:NADH dehydrogenase [ubiquinone] 1 alpha subcomplex assembly factor 2 [Halyomorpha halys]